MLKGSASPEPQSCSTNTTSLSSPSFSHRQAIQSCLNSSSNPNIGSSVAARQSTRENINRGNDGAQVSNRGNHTVTNTQHIRNGVGQVRNRNDDLRPDWRTHVFAQHSANWHHDWDRSRDHWWNGHHCRFVNGSWVIFDVGFDPWWSWPCPGYEYGYPCDDVYDDY